jgi:hypothetical protein
MHTYSSDTERVRALEAAQEEFRRTGVYAPPVPQALADYQATRHHRAAFGVTRPGPTPEPPGVDPRLVAGILQECAAYPDHANATSAASRRLRGLGLDAPRTSEALRLLDDLRSGGRDAGGW